MCKRLPSAMLMCGIILTLSTGCSIKEDRSGCPCLLVMDLGEIDVERFHRLAVRVEAPGGYLFHDFISGNPLPSSLSLEVPRGELSVNILSEEMAEESFAGITGGLQEGELYIVPEESECPPVYMQTGQVYAKDDSLHIPVRMLKNYCVVTVTMSAEGPYDFDIEVLGNIKGYDVNGVPVPGKFRHVTEPGSDRTCTVNIPRQTDNSLSLLIVDDIDVLREFALGEHLAERKYDWTAEELDDINVMIDYARAVITVKVDGWEEEFEFDVTL